MTIRLEDGIKNRLDQLANLTQRSKSFLAAQAIAAYVYTNEWQLAEIEAALAEADARDYATDQDMADLALKWTAGALFIVRPHAQHAHRLLFGKDFINQAMLNVDAPGVGACQVAHQFFKRWRFAEWVSGQQVQ